MNKFIINSESLVTTYDDRKSGFLSIALRKSKEASYYLNLASAFRSVVEEHSNPMDLLENENLLISMCDAAGISTKARGYLQNEDIKILLEDFIRDFILIKKNDYADEIVNRYLLTQGDALGGRMRNIIGGLASEKFTENIVAVLKVYNYSFSYFDRKTKTWIEGENFIEEMSKSVKAIRWKKDGSSRLMYYDLTVPIVKKNVDIVLFSSSNVDNTDQKNFKNFISHPNNYLALGELKGGIDPAGADEHWKTANTSLGRIRASFLENNTSIDTFFIGAAIEGAMAKEIFNQCKDGLLSNSANLTKTKQLTEICKWVVNL
jgi:hypothetical protein